MYDALTKAFTIPGPQNMSAVVDTLANERVKFKVRFGPSSHAVCPASLFFAIQDLGLLGNFLENQDLPRWRNLSVDPQSL